MSVGTVATWIATVVLLFHLTPDPDVTHAQEMPGGLDTLLERLQENTARLNDWNSLRGEQCRPIHAETLVLPYSSTANLTLWYRAVEDASNITVTWLDTTNPRIPMYEDPTPVHVDGTLWKATVSTTNRPGLVEVILRCPQISYTLHLNKSEENRTQSDLVPLRYQLLPSEELIYDYHPGSRSAGLEVRAWETASVTLFIHFRNPATNQMMEAKQVDWETWPMAIIFSNREHSPAVKRYEVATREFHTSGLVYVNFRSFKSPAKLVVYVQVTKQLKLRPVGQSEAFPDGYMGFDHHGLARGSDGKLHMTCSNHAPTCTVQCDAYGNHLTRLRMYRSSEHKFAGHQVPVRNRVPFGNTYHRSLTANAKTQRLEEEQVRYQCVARNGTGGEESLDIVVQHIIEVEIASRLKVAYLSDSRVKVTCTALGRPHPEVRFALRYDNDYQIVPPTHVSLWGPDYKKEAYVITSLYSDPHERTDRLKEVTCSADVTGSRPGHDHSSITIRDSNRRGYW